MKTATENWFLLIYFPTFTDKAHLIIQTCRDDLKLQLYSPGKSFVGNCWGYKATKLHNCTLLHVHLPQKTLGHKAQHSQVVRMKSNKLTAFLLLTFSVMLLMSSSEGFTGTVPGKRDSFRMVSIFEYFKNSHSCNQSSTTFFLKHTLTRMIVRSFDGWVCL